MGLIVVYRRTSGVSRRYSPHGASDTALPFWVRSEELRPNVKTEAPARRARSTALDIDGTVILPLRSS